ncbi:MAG: hypothetical protein JSW25_01735 [Thermoplasmata archaeon]|nr:MAG: hypothetical protein JSW25_01735 [Thermoplasmata archaeon]
MADTATTKMGVRGQGKRINRRLPDGARVEFHRICVLCRKRPRVTGGVREDKHLHVKDAVMIPQDDVTFEGQQVDGNYKLMDRDIEAADIVVKHHKVRGSRNHHKFMVILTNGVVS